MLKADIPIAFLAPFFLLLFYDYALLHITVLAVQSVFVCLLLVLPDGAVQTGEYLQFVHQDGRIFFERRYGTHGHRDAIGRPQ